MSTALRFARVAVVSIFVLFCTLSIFGQGITNGSIAGTVLDQKGAVVVGANVTALSKSTNVSYSGTTNSTGYFTIQNLPNGLYTVTVQAPGFSKLTVNDV